MPLTIAQAIKRSVALDNVSDSARIDTEVLLSFALKKNRTYLYTWPEQLLSLEQETVFIQWLERRLSGEPVAYIVGEKEFWSLPLAVNNSTLIPRPDTEIVVESALSLFAGDTKTTARRVIDLGTGTGAIALALAHEKKNWQLIAVDNNLQACELAKTNARTLQLANVTVVHSHWLAAVDQQPVDMIVSNPPYIEQSDPHLQQGDVRFEPRSALSSGKDGLEDIRIIAKQAYSQLVSGGWLVIEHGYRQADAVLGILHGHAYRACSTVNDLSGNPRVTLGQKHDE